MRRLKLPAECSSSGRYTTCSARSFPSWNTSTMKKVHVVVEKMKRCTCAATKQWGIRWVSQSERTFCLPETNRECNFAVEFHHLVLVWLSHLAPVPNDALWTDCEHARELALV